MKLRKLVVAAVLALCVETRTNAATFSSSDSAPTFDGADMANLGNGTGTDKWFVEDTAAGDPKGQSFKTIEPIVLNAISYRVGSTSKAEPTKVYIVRLGVISGTSFYEVYREQATQSASWATNQYATWTFATPPTLYSNVTYGIDVGMKSSTSSWSTGIPYLQHTVGGFTGGAKYYSPRPSPWVAGEGTAVAVFDSANDRIFHLDAIATTITDTTAPSLTNIVDSVSGGPIYEDRVKLVYTLYFDESVDASTIGLADFENAGSGVTLTSVESVTQIAGPHPLPSTVTMVVGVSGTGTLQLRLASGADIKDMFGNTINSPVTDDTTITVNSGTTPSTGTIYWDGASPASIGDGVSQGGSGTWSTTDVSWDRGFGLTPAVAWNNANNDSAYFAGTAGTVTLGGDITVSNLTIYTANNYFIGAAAEDNTLNFVNAGRITVDGSAGSGDSTIRSGITGSPSLTFRGRANAAAVFSLLPPANVTMTLGTLSVVNTYASNKNLILGGESTNVVNKITWTVTSNQLSFQKKGTGTWTIESNMTLDDGKIFVEDGMLIMAGAANTNSHSINIGRTSGSVSTGKGKFMSGGTFTIMDTREHFIVYTGATLAPGVDGIGTITFGWSGTNDDTAKLNMNTGSIYEWEIGPNNTTDTVRVRKLTAKAATLLTGNITLKILDAGGKPKATDQLPVFTYDAGVTRTLGTITIDTSALLGGWTGTPSLVDNGTGTIYLTGLQAPVAGTLIQLK